MPRGPERATSRAGGGRGSEKAGCPAPRPPPKARRGDRAGRAPPARNPGPASARTSGHATSAPSASAPRAAATGGGPAARASPTAALDLGRASSSAGVSPLHLRRFRADSYKEDPTSPGGFAMTAATLRFPSPRAYHFALALAFTVVYALAVTTYLAAAQIMSGHHHAAKPFTGPSWSAPLKSVTPYSVQKDYGTSRGLTCTSPSTRRTSA